MIASALATIDAVAATTPPAWAAAASGALTDSAIRHVLADSPEGPFAEVRLNDPRRGW